jgi:hypothetical protein
MLALHTMRFGLIAGSVAACRVCATSGIVQINQKVQNLAVKVGEQYEFVACVRDAPDAGSIGTATAGLGAGGVGISSLSVPLSSTYQPVRVRWTTTASETLSVSVETPDHKDNDGVVLPSMGGQAHAHRTKAYHRYPCRTDGSRRPCVSFRWR